MGDVADQLEAVMLKISELKAMQEHITHLQELCDALNTAIESTQKSAARELSVGNSRKRDWDRFSADLVNLGEKASVLAEACNNLRFRER